MNGLYTWTDSITTRIFKKLSSMKFQLALWRKLKFQNLYTLFWVALLLLKLKTNARILSISWMKWSGMIFRSTLLALLKHRWGPINLKLFTRQSAPTCFYKIGGTDSPNCYFCNNFPKTVCHLLCQCEKVSPCGLNYGFFFFVFLFFLFFF